LTRDKLGKSFQYAKDKTLYSALSGNKFESVKTKITNYVDDGFLQSKIDDELKLLKQAVAQQTKK
jgi:hypothetical protein